ncbi:MAG TPA: hypothetical protein VFR09_03095 [Alphaproteobacteria bacterium]|nr:hypothetical protein [Alphaproteobacteria bacterium]
MGLGRIGFIAAFLMLGCVPHAHAVVNACTTVTVSTTQQLTAFATCKKFTNAASANECAITESASEWLSQYSGPPSGVTIGSCLNSGCTGSGYFYNGYCYYVDTSGSQTCTAVCTAQTGSTCNATGTTYIGSADTSGTGRCSAVATAIMGASYTATYFTTSTYSSYPYGCGKVPGKTTVVNDYTYAATTCASSSSGYYRFCACDSSTSCGGTKMGGSCYYIGASGANCDTTCSTHGGSDQSGVQRVGSSDNGSATSCSTLATAMLASTVTATYNASSGYHSGCSYSGTKGSYIVINDADSPTDVVSTPPTGFRFCACVN